MKTNTNTNTIETMQTQAIEKKLTRSQKDKLSALSIRLLELGFHGDELRSIMDAAVKKALAAV